MLLTFYIIRNAKSALSSAEGGGTALENASSS